MKDKILAIKQQADNLRSDLRSLRRLQQINKESIVETVDEAWKKIRVIIAPCGIFSEDVWILTLIE